MAEHLPAAAEPFRFGVFEIDPFARELRKHGVRIKLQDQPFAVLLILLEKPGQLVTKEELQQRLWPGNTFVEFDKGIYNAMKRLRETLGDEADTPRYIETIPKRGYRFIAEVYNIAPNVTPVPSVSLPRHTIASNPSGDQKSSVSEVAEPATKPVKSRGWLNAGAWALLATLFSGVTLWFVWQETRGRTQPEARIRSLAVLPMENLSHISDQDYLADGITAELIAKLGQNTGVRVISRRSVMQYKFVNRPLQGVASELGVDGLVEGTVERLGDHVRITAQLIRVGPERVLWAQSYDRRLNDVAAVQDDIVKEIVNEVQAKLLPERHNERRNASVVSWAAYEAYLRGISEEGRSNGETLSITCFEQAIERQPDYASAYSGLAHAYIQLGHNLVLPPHEAFPKAKAAALKAVELDPELGEGHAHLAAVRFLYDWDFPTAEKEFQKAAEMNPNNMDVLGGYSDFLLAMGRSDEAIAVAKQMEQAEPAWYASNPMTPNFYWARRYDEAIEMARRHLKLEPASWGGHLWLGLSLEQKQEFPEAIFELKKAVELSDNKQFAGFLAHAYAVSGDKRSAEKILKDLEQLTQHSYVSSWWPAMIYSGLGKKEKAFLWLKKAYDDHEHDLVFSKVWPMFDPIRSDSRYQDLMKRVGFSE
jgi:TolB-like protein/DNA-binding winged helix-turn-helix (wHTH) protein/tetratricopeptide (TPR) repeat protein